MFNIYEFQKRVRSEEDQLLQELKQEQVSSDLKSNFHSIHCLEKNSELAKNYKTRIAHFIKQVRE